jgi:hypothetical protein
VVAIKAHGSIGPLAADRVTADDGETEVGEKAIVANSELTAANPDAVALSGGPLTFYAREGA